MSVKCIEKYRQKNGNDILKVILKPTQKFPEGFFYCDASDEKLVKSYIWYLMNRKKPYVVAAIRSLYSQQLLRFHREKAFNILGYYPDYINHINMVEFDNVNANLDEVTNQQNQWCRPSKGYKIVGRSFRSCIAVNSYDIYGKCVTTEVEACISVYQLEMQYEDYHYDFMKDRRHDLDILDLERTGKISEDEAVYRHVLRHAADNAWFYYRYNLTRYFADNHIPIPMYSLDSDGYMTHPITGQRLCPL